MVCCLGTKWKHSNCELQKLFGLKRYLICSVCFPLCTFACRPFKVVFMRRILRYVHERIFNILTSIKLCKKLSLSMGTQWQQQRHRGRRRRLTRATRIEFYVEQRTWHERNARIINTTTTTRTWHAKGSKWANIGLTTTTTTRERTNKTRSDCKIEIVWRFVKHLCRWQDQAEGPSNIWSLIKLPGSAFLCYQMQKSTSKGCRSREV